MLILKIILLLYIMKILGFFVLCIVKYKKNKANNLTDDTAELYSVDIILPMYNEEAVALKTLLNLLNISYGNFNIIVVDDGSTDNSLRLVNEKFGSHPKVKIIHQENRGKAVALSNALSVSKSDIIISIDADTLVQPDLINRFLACFEDKKVAAVAGYLKVGNRTNLLTKIQHVEYITDANNDRAIFECINGIRVIPGAVGAFRRDILLKIGGYSSDTLTEDNELTLRILCNKYIIKNAPEAVAYTEVPPNLKIFIKQRSRWKVGTTQVLYKYTKEAYLKSNKTLLFVILPYAWVYKIILPVVIPIVEYYCLVSLMLFPGSGLLPFYLGFLLMDTVICISILMKQKEQFSLMTFVLLQRFLLRNLTLLVYFNVFYKVLKGNLFNWEKIVKYGNSELG